MAASDDSPLSPHFSPLTHNDNWASTVDASVWSQYFERSRDVTLPNTNDVFRVYELGNAVAGTPLFVLHHGGGHTAMSWALAAAQLYKIRGKSNMAILAFDCRGHGSTRAEDEGDLSLSRLSTDMLALLKALYGASMPDLFFVGHSLGGAVVVEAAKKNALRVQGVAVVDVVEGTALEAVTGTALVTFLRQRPRAFAGPADAVQWSLDSGTIRNAESAAISMPPQVVRDPSRPPSAQYVWRTDLMASQRFWKGWYENLSEKFLSVRSAKLLILAGPDRLDKPLMIGQMQGKFSLKMLPACGHTVQEDQPEGVAAILLDFMQRNGTIDIAAIRKRTMGV